MWVGNNMFDKQNYINNYIKDSYKTIKVRWRKDNAVLIRVYNFINNDISIDVDLSPKIERLTKEAEEADILNDYGLYMNLAYAIDAEAKKEVSNNNLKESQWNKLAKRYCLWQK